MGRGNFGDSKPDEKDVWGFYCSVVEYNIQPCFHPSSKSSLSSVVFITVLGSEFALEGHDKVLGLDQQ